MVTVDGGMTMTGLTVVDSVGGSGIADDLKARVGEEGTRKGWVGDSILKETAG